MIEEDDDLSSDAGADRITVAASMVCSPVKERDFPIDELRLLASERSRGGKLLFGGEEHEVKVLGKDSFEGIDIVLASAGASRSKEFLPYAVKAGAVCVDNSSAYRMEKNVPLVVPEVNPHAIKGHRGIIANPNCSTIQMVLPLCAIKKVTPLKRVVVTTYQSVSGAGQGNILEMEKQVIELSKKESHFGVGEHTVDSGAIKKFPHQIAYNLIPHIDVFVDGFYTKEEVKMVNETRKILGEPDLPITATCVRVPVYIGHSEAVHVEFTRPMSPDEAQRILTTAPGVRILDDPTVSLYPQPWPVSGSSEVFVGRIRTDISHSNGLVMWIVADNLRKGAALNAIQIAEEMVNRGWI